MAATDAPLRLIVGLGNPGDEYAATRHNAGFWLLDRLADGAQLRFRREAKLQGELARLDGGSECWLFKPQTFMNRSGDAVGAVLRFYRIEPREILVVHDDLDLPAGAVRLKRGGGHGGHNGLRDLAEKLGTGDYLRLRIGIGHPGSAPQVVGYVLGRPSAAERESIDGAIGDALRELPAVLGGEAERVMNLLNRRGVKAPSPPS
ncbi:MAG TPA: aminoacyl-tRNA hydrolase [Gammaproteobacteria bacterium]|nr:aminoacyl-tRNA hydrolase [Gammaproteobacteria bacterium]